MKIIGKFTGFTPYGDIAEFVPVKRGRTRYYYCELGEIDLEEVRFKREVEIEVEPTGNELDPLVGEFALSGDGAKFPIYEDSEGVRLLSIGDYSPLVRGPQPRGTCFVCGREYSKTGMLRHLQSCAGSGPDEPDGAEELVRIRAEAGRYWLDLEMSYKMPASALDAYLREIWYEECCHHLSAFIIKVKSKGNLSFMVAVHDERRQSFMERPIGRFLEIAKGGLDHIYDFGDRSECRISERGRRRANKPLDGIIRLVSRNLPHEGDEHNSPRDGVCGYEGPAVPPEWAVGTDG